jgi:hypothetical protein
MNIYTLLLCMSLFWCVTLKTEAACHYETSLYTCKITHCFAPEQQVIGILTAMKTWKLAYGTNVISRSVQLNVGACFYWKFSLLISVLETEVRMFVLRYERWPVKLLNVWNESYVMCAVGWCVLVLETNFLSLFCTYLMQYCWFDQVVEVQIWFL